MTWLAPLLEALAGLLAKLAVLIVARQSGKDAARAEVAERMAKALQAQAQAGKDATAKWDKDPAEAIKGKGW